MKKIPLVIVVVAFVAFVGLYFHNHSESPTPQASSAQTNDVVTLEGHAEISFPNRK